MDTTEECQRKEYPEEFGNGVHLEEEEGVDHVMGDLMKEMKEEGLAEEDRNDRDEWRRKIEL